MLMEKIFVINIPASVVINQLKSQANASAFMTGRFDRQNNQNVFENYEA